MPGHSSRPSTTPSVSAPIRWAWPDVICLVVIVAVAAAIRLHHLGTWSLWLDEAFTVHDAFHITAEVTPGKSVWTSSKYPVNYWLVGQAMRQWGTSEYSLRILPCLAGIASIGVVFIAVRRNAGRACAVLAASFMCVSAWHIYWSQNARHYAPMLLFSSIGMFAAFEIIHRRAWRYVPLAVLALMLGTLTHPTAAAVVPAIGLFAVWQFAGAFLRLSRRAQLACVGVLVLLGTGLAIRFIPILRVALSVKQGGNLPYFIATVVQYMEPPLLLVAAAGVVMVWRADRAWGAFLTAYALVPAVAILGGATIMDLSALYVFVTLPAVCALAAHAVVGLSRPPMGSRLVAIVLAAVVFTHQIGESILYFTHRYGNRPRWREAAEYLTRVGAPYDRIVSTGGPALAYHLGFEPQTLRLPEPLLWLGERHRDEVKARSGPQWLVFAGDTLSLVDPDGSMQAWLTERAVCVAEFPAWTNVKDRTIRIYRVDGPPSTPAG